jgi:hypothetical protein
MSELVVGSLKGLAANSFVIDVASGSKIVQPGAILQVVSAAKTDTFSTNSSTLTDVTGLSASITPSSTSSKIFVQVSLSYGYTTTPANPRFTLVRASTAIGIGDSAGSRPRVTTGGNSGHDSGPAANLAMSSISMTFLDSPSTTSATTYKVQMAGNGDTIYVNRAGTDSDNSAMSNARGASTITLIEVAG